MLAYYIQDDESMFGSNQYNGGANSKNVAKETYITHPEVYRFCKTRWVKARVQTHGSLSVALVSPSLDHAVYHYKGSSHRISEAGSSRPYRVCLMARNGRRNFEGSQKFVFEVLKREKNIEFFVFGMMAKDFKEHPQIKVLNEVSKYEVATVLRKSDFFVDLSFWQAFGRTGLEAMASGTIPFLPLRGGATVYARSGNNSILWNTEDIPSCVEKFMAVLRNKNLQTNLLQSALLTSKQFSLKKASFSIYKRLWGHFSKHYRKRRAKLVEHAERYYLF
jgi:glycosyltransferase involved in cell wall biosynthesis